MGADDGIMAAEHVIERRPIRQSPGGRALLVCSCGWGGVCLETEAAGHERLHLVAMAATAEALVAEAERVFDLSAITRVGPTLREQRLLDRVRLLEVELDTVREASEVAEGKLVKVARRKLAEARTAIRALEVELVELRAVVAQRDVLRLIEADAGRAAIAAVERVRALHAPVNVDHGVNPVCGVCQYGIDPDYYVWPCPTIDALEGREDES